MPHRFRAQPAAFVALLALVGFVAIAVSGAVAHAGDFILAVASIFVFALAGWFVLTRSFRRGLLGLPAVLLGLAGIVAFVATYVFSLLALVAALVLFGFAGRYAVAQDRSRPQAARRSGRPAEPARQGVLIINPKSGGGKAERLDLLEEARRRGIEPLLLEPGTDLRELAERAVSDGADVIGMAGGDGSQALVAGVAMAHDIAHVCVPAGTRNHFALDLGLDRNDILGALDAYTDGIERRVDLACVNGRVFVNNASLGLYARVVQSDVYRGAKLGTWRQMLPQLLGPGATSADLRFEAPDESDWANAAFVVVSNNPYQVRRFSGAGTRPRLDTGRLGILVTRIGRATDMAKLVTLGALGQSKRFGGLREWSTPEFEVSSGSCVAAGLDGESLSLSPPLRFVSLPGALRVRLPRQARGFSPAAAAVSVSRNDFVALLRIAVGKRGCQAQSEPDAGLAKDRLDA